MRSQSEHKATARLAAMLAAALLSTTGCHVFMYDEPAPHPVYYAPVPNRSPSPFRFLNRFRLPPRLPVTISTLPNPTPLLPRTTPHVPATTST